MSAEPTSDDNPTLDEVQPLSSATNDESLDQNILRLIHQCPLNDSNHYVIKPAYLASRLGISLDDAQSELCGLMSAVGGGEDGASFVFEKVESLNASTMTMVFTFPCDFESRALSYRRKLNWYTRFVTLSKMIVKAVKIFTAFGLIVSLAVLMIAGICLLVAAVIAMARGGGRNNNHHQILMHKLRFLIIQLRQILWLYAICGGGSQDDPFMREVAGDLAMILSCCVGSPMNMWFLMRMGGRRRRGGGLFELNRRGWGSPYSWRMNRRENNDTPDDDGVAMVQRGSWGNIEEERVRSSSSSFDSQTMNQQRGLLSVAVEFLFGPSDNDDKNRNTHGGSSTEELEKWKFRAAIIVSLSAASGGKGVSMRDLLPYTDTPPASINDASALRAAMSIILYFNGQPANNASSETSSGIDARFHFPELMAEMEIYDVSQRIISLGNSHFAPPQNTESSIKTLLYQNEEEEEDDLIEPTDSFPKYFYEKPKLFTHLSKQQFCQCLFLGVLNYIGVISVQSALLPGGAFDLSLMAAMAIDPDRNGATSTRHRRRFIQKILIPLGSVVALKLLRVLQFYANLFFLLPLIRLVILATTNYFIARRNRRRLSFVVTE